ncbi:MAG: aminopeptidase P family protein [Clostridiales bacterium]|jgi:Xaa-Pro aminopeptidase|nr:aminopeptidase P family protein [Clostridiales bacterium]
MKNAVQLFLEDQFDAVVVLKDVNKYYFTDFVSENSVLLLFRDNATFFLDKRYTEAAREKFRGTPVAVADITGVNPYEAVREELVGRGATRLGYEDAAISYADYRILESLGMVLVGERGSIDEARKIKDESELARIERAAEIADTAYSAAVGLLHEGVSEKEIADEIVYRMRREGAEDVSFDPIIAFGENTSRPHHVYTERKLKAGDAVTMDIGAKFKGYCSDMTRSFLYRGGKNLRYAETYCTVLEGQKNALKHIKAGVSGRVADAYARDFITRAGYGEYFTHSLGHSVGLEIHEEPRLSERSTDILKAGNIVTVEPGIYLEGEFGIRIEDMVCVTENGIVNFTKAEKNMCLE